MLRTLVATTAAILLASAPALALTVTNTGSKEYTIGIDMGDKENVETIGAGKSFTIKGCDDGCGVTGPWDYSKMAKTGDKIESDGKSTIYK